MALSVAIIGTDLAPLAKSAGALEMLCLGWSTFLRSRGFNVYNFSVSLPLHELKNDEQVVTFGDPSSLPSMLDSCGIEVAIVNNRPGWYLGNNRARLNIFHNYPDAWNVDVPNLSDSLSTSRNLAVSAALAGKANETYPSSNTGLIYPFIGEEFLSAHNSQVPYPPSTKLRVLFPNRTLEKKGLRWLISTIDRHLSGQVALTVVRNIAPWTRETQEHRNLLELCRSRPYVTITNRVSDSASLVGLYLSHDVVVAPSIRAEGLGLIPLEAQALGIPVVTSDLGGLPESVFTPNRVVEAENEIALAQALVEARNLDQIDRAQIQQRVKDKFSLETSGHVLARELRRLLDRDGFG